MTLISATWALPPAAGKPEIVGEPLAPARRQSVADAPVSGAPVDPFPGYDPDARRQPPPPDAPSPRPRDEGPGAPRGENAPRGGGAPPPGRGRTPAPDAGPPSPNPFDSEDRDVRLISELQRRRAELQRLQAQLDQLEHALAEGSAPASAKSDADNLRAQIVMRESDLNRLLSERRRVMEERELQMQQHRLNYVSGWHEVAFDPRQALVMSVQAIVDLASRGGRLDEAEKALLDLLAETNDVGGQTAIRFALKDVYLAQNKPERAAEQMILAARANSAALSPGRAPRGDGRGGAPADPAPAFRPDPSGAPGATPAPPPGSAPHTPPAPPGPSRSFDGPNPPPGPESGAPPRGVPRPEASAFDIAPRGSDNPPPRQRPAPAPSARADRKFLVSGRASSPPSASGSPHAPPPPGPPSPPDAPRPPDAPPPPGAPAPPPPPAHTGPRD